MSWQPTLTRLAAAMTPHAFLAIVEHGHRDLSWRAELTEVIVRHSRSRGYDPAFSLVDALCAAGLLELAGRAETTPIVFRQSVADYVAPLPSPPSPALAAMAPRAGRAGRPAVGGPV